MAPELWADQPLGETPTIDQWAMGIILFKMIENELPMGDPDDDYIQKPWAAKQKSFTWNCYGRIFWKIFVALTQKTPSHRPNMNEVLTMLRSVAPGGPALPQAPTGRQAEKAAKRAHAKGDDVPAEAKRARNRWVKDRKKRKKEEAKRQSQVDTPGASPANPQP